MKKIIVSILTIGMLLTIMPLSTGEKVADRGNILYVGGSGSGNYTKIQDAINAASDGDTIFVMTGTYYENLLVNKRVSLIGENRYNTIIDGSKHRYVIQIIEDQVKISGFTIQNSGNNTWLVDAGINVSSSYNIISENIFSNNLIGVFVNSSDNNIISDNDIISSYFGILLLRSGSYQNTIISNNISNNKDGIYLYSSSNNNIKENGIISNERYGLCLDYGDNNSISDNMILQNDVGIRLGASSHNNISGNIISNNNYDGIEIDLCGYNEIMRNTISNNVNTGIHLISSWRNVISLNNLRENNFGIFIEYLSCNNKVYHNNFVGNYQNAYSEETSFNFWDDGYPSGGNYWDDYTGEDNDGDGLGDTSYNIPDGDDQDNYPLMYPWGDSPPYAPLITGPTSGKAGISYNYNLSSTDPNGDNVYYYVDWGDNTNSGWLGPYSSGEMVTVSHTWSLKGTYTIKAKAKDIYGAESDWAILPVTMPMDQPQSNPQNNPSLSKPSGQPSSQQGSQSKPQVNLLPSQSQPITQPSSQPSTNQQSVTSATTPASTPATTTTTTTSTAPTSKSTSLPTSR